MSKKESIAKKKQLLKALLEGKKVKKKVVDVLEVESVAVEEEKVESLKDKIMKKIKKK